MMHRSQLDVTLSIGIVKTVIVTAVISNFLGLSECQAEKGYSPPICSLELLKDSFQKSETLQTVTLTFDPDKSEKFKCQRVTGKIDFRRYILCQAGFIQIYPGFVSNGIGSLGFRERILLNCSATYPIDFHPDFTLPFSGLEVKFGKTFAQNLTSHWVAVTLPKTSEVQNEGLSVFNGSYRFFSTSSPRTNSIPLEFARSPGIHPYPRGNVPAVLLTNTEEEEHGMQDQMRDGICVSLFDNRAECTVKYSSTDLYLVNVGGNNPTETRIIQPCLNSDLENTCGNKYPGTNCLQNRYCKKIKAIHQNGLVRCTADNETQDAEYFTDLNAEIHTNMSDIWLHHLIIRIEKENQAKIHQISGDEDYKTDINTNNEIGNDSFSSSITSEFESFPDYGSQLFPEIILPSIHREDCLGNIDRPFQPLAILEMDMYDKQIYELECHFLPYILVPPVIWAFRLINGSTMDILKDYGGNTTTESKFYVPGKDDPIIVSIRSSHAQIKAFDGVESVICNASYWNSSKMASSLLSVKILVSEKPVFNHTDVEETIPLSESFLLLCNSSVGGKPPPMYSWEKDGKPLSNQVYDETTGTYNLHRVKESDSGMYTCIARNFLGEAKKNFHVSVRVEKNNTWLWTSMATIFVAILLIIILIFMYRKYLVQRTRLTELEIKEFVEGNVKKVKSNDYAHEKAQYLPYNKDFEVAYKDFNIENTELGKGAHGIVYKGTLGGTPVAIKTVRPGVEKVMLIALLKELKIMTYLGKHENVVQLLGSCTEYLNEGRVYVLVEYCPLGSLQMFLQNNRPNFVDYEINEYVNGGPISANTSAGQFTRQDLLRWSIQIAKGMQYLSSKRVVHGDLATRNILLSSLSQTKITDFGLSRQLVNTDTYVKRHQEMLPWRWLAMESMRDFVFTTKSDVWSYGVTVWEIFSLGQIPYPGMSWNAEFLQLLEDDLRLSKPKFATETLYKILTTCWDPIPERRPNFVELGEKLAQFIRT